MTMDCSTTSDFKQRDVVYFIHLHLDTARKTDKPSLKEKHRIYEVEGKARPMLIRCIPRKGRGGKWYHVYPITTKDRGVDRTKPIGSSIDPDDNSYISVDPQWYPENLVSRENGRSPKVKTLDQEVFDNILRIIGNQSMKQSRNSGGVL